jgi:hypothetical protein
MAETKFTSYDEVLKSGLIGDVLYLVISNKGNTKTYKDLLPLDGGTVGIASFAVGGLEILYKNMNTQTYFGKTEKEMIDGYSTKCRPAGKSGDDNGWGCYSQKFWYDGMKLFLDSSDSKSIQEKAWSAKMKVDIEEVIKKGWNTKRQIAIALSISNSLGIGGMKSIADSNKWDAEKTLQNYAKKSENNEKRRKLIDENFPFVKNVETTNEPNNTPTSNTPSTPANSIAEDKVETPKGPDFPEDKIFTFNVENSKFLVSAEIGTFSVVPINPEFDFEQDFDQVLLDDEFYEEEFAGTEVEALDIEANLIFFKDTQSTEGSTEDNYVDPNSGERALVFNGKKFEQPDVKKRLNTTYYLYIDYKKMPKPKLTKQKLIDIKLKVEGGLTGNPKDSAAKTGYCPTLKNGQKYHTNKGVTYAVWKKTFGTKNDNRFLNMNLDDWSKIFNGSFWNNNATSKYESVNCLYTCFSWGGSKSDTVNEAKKLLGVTNIDSVSEEQAVAALLSARAQLFVNISQPGVDNNVFRKGWINGTNNYIEQTYF